MPQRIDKPAGRSRIANANHRDDSYGYPRNPEWKERRLDGEGQR
jgi:hypothetical protein